MAVSQVSSGTQTAVVSTEHTLSTETSSGVYGLLVDLSNMVAGDDVTVRIKVKTLTGSTSALAFVNNFSNVQTEPVLVSVPIPVAHEVVFTLEQTAGTGRDFDWSVVSA